MAAAMVLSEKMSPQDATLRLVVRMTDPFWPCATRQRRPLQGTVNPL